MKKINGNAVKMYNDNLLSVQELITIKSNFSQFSADILFLIYARDEYKRGVIEKDINSLRESNNNKMSAFEKISEADEQDTYAQFKKLVENYRASYGKVIQLIDIQNYVEAEKAFEETKKIGNDMSEVLDELISQNVKQAEDADMENDAIFQTSSYMMLVIVIIAVLLAVALGLVLSSLISRKLNKVVKFAKAMGDGDFTSAVDIRSKDEIGKRDTEFVNIMSEEISQAASSMSEIIGQVASAIQTVSATAEEAAAGTKEILGSVNETTVAIEGVSELAQSQADLAEKLNSMILKFKI